MGRLRKDVMDNIECSVWTIIFKSVFWFLNCATWFIAGILWKNGGLGIRKNKKKK